VVEAVMRLWAQWAVALAIVLSVAAVAVPGLLSSQRAANEREAATMLKTLASAEADFRANDRDANGVNDFWTGDVTGLYSLKTSGRELRLIERGTAEADSCPIHMLCWPYRPRSGYYYQALEADDNENGETYFQDTGGNPRMGDVHHLSKFGFGTYPASGRDEKYSFIINEHNTVFRFRGVGHITRWPHDDDLKRLTG
jgi:type II secretory pathway pseudopilin PulG